VTPKWYREHTCVLPYFESMQFFFHPNFVEMFYDIKSAINQFFVHELYTYFIVDKVSLAFEIESLYTPLHFAIQCKNENSIKYFLRLPNIDVNGTHVKETMLYAACVARLPEIACLLIDMYKKKRSHVITF
jgi:ankyrin repeat protein